MPENLEDFTENQLTEEEVENLKTELNLQEDNKSLFFEDGDGIEHHFSKVMSADQIRERVKEKREE